ncbi:MAG: hypothetical protein OHK0050_30920 [Roseiflexaceae bacterium]
MPKQEYSIVPNGPKRITLEWQGFGREVMVRFDGQTLGMLRGQEELNAGQQFALPDGSALQVQLVRTWFSAELRVLRNGKPVPGSPFDPITRWRTAFAIVCVLAGLNVVLGLIAEFFRVESLLNAGIGTITMFYGLIYLMLAFFVQRRSLVALVLATAFFALDSIVGIALGIADGQAPGLAGILVRFFILVPLIQGVIALREIVRIRDGV